LLFFVNATHRPKFPSLFHGRIRNADAVMNWYTFTTQTLVDAMIVIHFGVINVYGTQKPNAIVEIVITKNV